MFTKNKYLLLELIVLVLISLTPLFWFKSGHVILGLDSGYSLDHIKFFEYRMHTWIPTPNFGVDMSSEMGLLPLVALPALISYLGVALFHVQKILLIGWFFTLAVSVYVLLRELFPNREQWTVRLVGTFIYLFNFHLYSFWLQGEQPMLASYVILPLFTLFLYKFAIGKTKLLKTAVLLNITYLFFSSGGTRGVPLIGPVILAGIAIFMYFGVLNWKREGFSYILRFFYLSVLFIILMFPLNAYWIFPFVASFSHEFNSQVTIAGGISGAISWAQFISSHDSFLNLFRLQGDNNWYYFPFLWSNNYLVNPLLIFLSFVFSALAFTAPILAKRKQDKKIVLLFSLFALTALFFAAGAHPPFGGLYVFMMEHIPVFATFRSAYYKFMPAVYFSCAILIGYTVYSLTTNMKKYMAMGAGVAFLLFIVIYNYPYFQNTNAAFNKPFTTMVKIPSYVTDFGDMINHSHIAEKTLVLPQTNTRNTIKEYTWGYYGSFSLFALMTDKPFVQYDAYLFNDSANALINTMYNKLRERDYDGFYRAVRTSGIKYILLTKDVAYNYKVTPLENPLLYEKILSDKKHFKKIWSRGQWIFYEILDKTVQQEVTAQTSVSVIYPDESGLNSYFENSGNPFVLASQIDSRTLSKLIKTEELTQYSCVSCVLFTPQKPPELPYPSVRPGSFLYTFKLKRDEKLLSQAANRNQKIDTALGLSLKRISELNVLLYRQLKPQEEGQWITSARLAVEYWTFLENLLKNNPSYPDYGLYVKIHNYKTVEMSVLDKFANHGVTSTSPQLTSLISQLTTKIAEVDKAVEIVLNEKDWNQNFLYSVSKDKDLQEVTIADQSFSPALIVSREKDTSTFQEASTSPFYNANESSSLVNVQLPELPNLLTGGKVTSITFKDGIKSCLVYNVADYHWNRKYVVGAVSTDKTTSKLIYVGMNRKYFKTQDYPMPQAGVFIPDFVFDPDREVSALSGLEFTGQPNDLQASVYFCTNDMSDPTLAFENPFVRERVVPEVYSFKRIQKEKERIPVLRYKKIDATRYTVEVVNARHPFILSFLQASSPNWKLYSGGQEQRDKFIINGFANGWYIQKKGTYTMTIEFHTQQAFYSGIAVTLVSFGVVLLYLVVDKRRSRRA